MRFSRPGRGGDPGLQLIGEDKLVSELRGENAIARQNTMASRSTARSSLPRPDLEIKKRLEDGRGLRLFDFPRAVFSF